MVALADAGEEALYLQRYEAQQSAAIVGGGLPAYDPLVTIRGRTRPLPVGEARIAKEALRQADAYAAEHNSAALLVWQDDALAHETYFGNTDRSTLINAKSLAKPVTAILIGRAIFQGHIASLDQPVCDFITEWRSDPDKSRILVRHLLDMRTGLLPQGPADGPSDILNRAYLHPRHDEIIIAEYPLVNEPGSRYEYANANSELVAPLIERATGQRYHDYLSDALLIPMGAQGGTIWLNRPDGTAHSGCCVQLPSQTWLRLGVLLLNDGIWDGERLLPAGYVGAMRVGTEQNPHAGLGVWVAGPYVEKRGSLHPSLPLGQTDHAEPYAADDLFLFDGNDNQVVYVIPSAKMVALRLGGRPPEGAPWDNSHLPNTLLGAVEWNSGERLPQPQLQGE